MLPVDKLTHDKINYVSQNYNLYLLFYFTYIQDVNYIQMIAQDAVLTSSTGHHLDLYG